MSTESEALMSTVWILVTNDKWGGPLAMARQLGGSVTAVVVAPRSVADAVGVAGADEVLWVDTHGLPAEAFAGSLAAKALAAAPAAVIGGPDPAARSLLGAITARLGAALLPGVVSLVKAGEGVVAARSALGGAVTVLHALDGAVGVICEGEPGEAGPTDSSTPVTPLELEAGTISLVGTVPEGGASGLNDAATVVSFGRGVRTKGDVALVEQLAVVLGAELACSMPVADDLGWLPKERYVGRSGQHIAPRLYLAVGIDGAPQHMEGVRGAKVVVAINNNPDARIFRVADYGIVGDLYDAVPALIDALKH